MTSQLYDNGPPIKRLSDDQQAILRMYDLLHRTRKAGYIATLTFTADESETPAPFASYTIYSRPDTPGDPLRNGDQSPMPRVEAYQQLSPATCYKSLLIQYRQHWKLRTLLTLKEQSVL